MKKTLLSLTIGLSIMGNQIFAGAATGGATEPTQMMNNVELVLSNAQLLKEVETSINQLQTMYTNLKKLKEFVNNGDAIIEELLNLNQIIQYGQALAYNANNMSEEFNERYKDFDKFYEQVQAQNGKYDHENAKGRYQKWSRQNLDNVNSALRAANLQSKYFQTEAQTIKEIERKAQTAEGRDQLLQAGVEIASLQAKQMIQLRQLIASDLQMQANYQASVIDRQAEKDAWEVNANKIHNDQNPNSSNYPKISNLGKSK
ncbi:P-type conjugative transfer protein TrbJ [Cardiobacterium hominis]|uniref:P-type conjugative transfer protein TrbJ n=1 Tax=Cardiobacterium hominis TaxID=2718 RepID=UPI0028E33350|nr:P-type conjugative transfer protein TrbJ [Cardiobacterium hominis]